MTLSMANEEHLKIIKQGVKAWNALQDPHALRGENPRELSGADLREAWLNGALLVDANLDNADLGLARLQRANLLRADIRDARLVQTDMDEANLSHVDFSRSDLRGADLNGSNLFMANFSDANLRGANIVHADFTGADLSRTDLSKADLRGTTFHGTNLEEANFSGAKIGQTLFDNCDLSEVRGLDAVKHKGPSTIGVDTLYKSDAKIPEAFLRGIGLPEAFITYLPSLIARPIEFYSCFISYSHADKSFARRLHDALQGRGIRCWLDEHELLPGDKIYTEVDRGIRLWDKVLLCCSKDALTSWWVDNEIKIAFDKEQHLWRERGKEVLALIPLNLDDYLLTGKWQSGLATEVKARLAANFEGWERENARFEAQFERLLKALRTDGGGKRPPPPTKL